jgi:hypothetical protein
MSGLSVDLSVPVDLLTCWLLKEEFLFFFLFSALLQLLVNFCNFFRELESKQIPSILTGRMSSLNFIFTVKMCASRCGKLGKMANLGEC